MIFTSDLKGLLSYSIHQNAKIASVEIKLWLHFDIWNVLKVTREEFVDW
jgi:hypothetical protein